MSELKVYALPLKTNIFGRTIVAQSYYLKSEADKVIAELERDIVKLKSSLKYLVVRGLIDGPVKKAVEDLLKEVEDAH